MQIRLMVFILALVGEANVLADQCSFITKEQAQAAQVLLSRKEAILSYCALCGDKKIQIDAVQNVTAEPLGYENYWGVSVGNAKAIDLAYTFVETTPETYEPISSLIGCPTEGHLGTFFVKASTVKAALKSKTVRSVSCTLDLEASNKLVESELAKRPDRKNLTGDNGAILLTHLISLKANLGSAKSSGLLVASEGAEDAIFSKATQNKDGMLVFHIDSDGWDHYNYVIALNPKTRRATLYEAFDYDCGGSGSEAYGVLNCELTETR